QSKRRADHATHVIASAFEQLAGRNPVHRRVTDGFLEQLLEELPGSLVMIQMMRQDTYCRTAVLAGPRQMLGQLGGKHIGTAAAARAVPVDDVQMDIDAV